MDLNENAEWYVRAMVTRGIMALEQSNHDGRKWLAGEGKDAAVSFRQSVEGMIAYQEQMLAEARQYIPMELLPR